MVSIISWGSEDGSNGCCSCKLQQQSTELQFPCVDPPMSRNSATTITTSRKRKFMCRHCRATGERIDRPDRPTKTEADDIAASTEKTVPNRLRRVRCRSDRERFTLLIALLAAATAAAEEEQQSTTTVTTKSIGQTKGIVLTEDYCNRNYVQISRLSILCDTPGAYYHGSNAYRNSEVCMSGDKANLDVSFDIPQGLKTAIIYVEIEFGIYDNFKSVYKGSLCQMNVAQEESFLINDEVDDYWGDSSVCPHPGAYRLQTYYSVPAIRDFTFHYTPDVRMTFSNEHGKVIGCAVTGPSALRLFSERRAVQGLFVLGTALLLFLGIFSILLILSHRRKERLELQREKRNHHAFGLNYPYLRTMPDGQVQPEMLPTPRIANHAISEDDDEDSENALNISNPAYNETHMPTRPII